jgi:RHS repeat-associated protein
MKTIFSQAQQVNYAPWQHPILQALDKKPTSLVEFHHLTDDDYYVPLAILDKTNHQLYYVTTFGQIFDSIPVGPKLSKQLIEKNIDPFTMYLSYATVEQLIEVEQIKNLLRINGQNIISKIPKVAYYNYSTLKNANSSLEKMQFLDNLEKFIWQQYFLLNLTLNEKQDSIFLAKQSNWKNYKPSKLFIHETKPQNYVEYTHNNRFSSLSKAILYPISATVYLYSQENKIVDSFKIKKEKVNDLLSEKQDVFALYRNYLEWQLENVTNGLTILLKENNTSLASNTVIRNVAQQIDYYENDYWSLQQKISSTIIPDRDLLAINVLEQTNFTQRKKWNNENGWKIISPAPPPPSQGEIHTFTRGNKEYFLTDERGNVLATVSDRKILHSSDGITVDYYTADVVTATDYAPFGSQLPGRTYRNNGQQLKYGYNGKENDNEIKGEGNQQDYGFRIYDPRLGRFLSVDPLTKKYPHYTPYSFAGNKPIAFVDLDGLEEGLEMRTRRREQALLNNTITEDQYKQQTLASGAGGVIGAAIAVDVFITKGKISQFLLTSQILGHLYHNGTNNPVEQKKRMDDLKSDAATLLTVSAIGKGVNVLTEVFSGGKAIYKSFNSASIRTTQTTVNGVEKYVQAFSKGMKYTAEPIDIVKMEDGIYSSADHARLMAAEKLGIDLKANTHNFNDKISIDQAKRFVPEGTVEANLPKTWGEAIKERVKGQGPKYAKDNPNGSFDRPKVKS